MLKKGKCVNIGLPCSKALKKEIQEVDSLNFICPECGQPLVEVVGIGGNKGQKGTNGPKNPGDIIPEPPRKTFLQKYGKVIGIGVGVLAIAGGAFAFLGNGSDTTEEKEFVEVDSVPRKTEPVEVPESAPEPAPKNEINEETNNRIPPTQPQTQSKAPTQITSQVVTKDFGYAVWTGKMKNGKMHDTQGTLTFKSSHIIDIRDDKQRVANAGDRVIGTFENGHLVQGRWYKSDGNTESIILGCTD